MSAMPTPGGCTSRGAAMGLDSMVRWRVLDKANRLIAVRLPCGVSSILVSSAPAHAITIRRRRDLWQGRGAAVGHGHGNGARKHLRRLERTVTLNGGVSGVH